MKNEVKILNAAKLDAMIKEAEGRATARRLTPAAIVEALETVQERLFTVSTKKDAVGTEVSVDVNHQHFPNAYKYTPESTHFIAIYTARGWKVMRIWRDRCWPESTLACINFTDATRAAMVERLSYMG